MPDTLELWGEFSSQLVLLWTAHIIPKPTHNYMFQTSKREGDTNVCKIYMKTLVIFDEGFCGYLSVDAAAFAIPHRD